MKDRFQRTEMLLGREAMNKLSESRVAVFGLGGVGGHVAEALARTGVGALDLIDFDRVDITNLNRQIIATEETLGRKKTEAARDRIALINPQCRVVVHDVFYKGGGSAEGIDLGDYDYIVDAIDTVAGKLALIEGAKAAGVPIICAMGAGNKLDASAFEVADIYETTVCPLAKVMRKECRKRGIDSLKVVYSREEPIRPVAEPEEEESETGKRPPGSVAFAPAVVGLIMAGEVVKDICGIQEGRAK